MTPGPIVCLTATALALGLLLSAGASRAQVSAEEAGRAIAERFGVEVLRVQPGKADETPVWVVTVMKPGGNANDAFQVTTLAVDQESGELVPAFRHRSSGYSLPPGGWDTRLERQPESMRSGTWR